MAFVLATLLTFSSSAASDKAESKTLIQHFRLSTRVKVRVEHMGLIETEAIILHSFKLGEADKIVVALSRQEGVVRGVARGARRLKSKYGASLEPFTIISLSFFEKESRELVSLTHAEIIKSYFELTRDDSVFAILEHIAGLILEFAPLRVPDERFYRMLRACLEAISSKPEDTPQIARYSEIWTLKLSGFLPDLSRCASCRKKFEGQNAGAVLAAGSALECAHCSGGKGIAVPRETLDQLASALKNTPSAWARGNRQDRGNSSQTGQVLIHTLITRALEREPRYRSRT
jgi:DNA repair protein RecO (recombination protein O)